MNLEISWKQDLACSTVLSNQARCNTTWFTFDRRGFLIMQIFRCRNCRPREPQNAWNNHGRCEPSVKKTNDSWRRSRVITVQYNSTLGDKAEYYYYVEAPSQLLLLRSNMFYFRAKLLNADNQDALQIDLLQLSSMQPQHPNLTYKGRINLDMLRVHFYATTSIRCLFRDPTLWL